MTWGGRMTLMRRRMRYRYPTVKSKDLFYLRIENSCCVNHVDLKDHWMHVAQSGLAPWPGSIICHWLGT
jgi:hypothetical protein